MPLVGMLLADSLHLEKVMLVQVVLATIIDHLLARREQDQIFFECNLHVNKTKRREKRTAAAHYLWQANLP